MSLLKLDITKKERVDKISQLELDKGDIEKYKVKAICNSKVYTSKSKNHLLGLYYLVSLRSYKEEKNTWELVIAVQHFQRFFITFHKKYLEK